MSPLNGKYAANTYMNTVRLNNARRSLSGVLRSGYTLATNLLSYHLLRKYHLKPLYFVWYVTFRCNLRCTFCDDGTGRPIPERAIPELDTERALALLSLLRRTGGGIYITGGEPLIRPDIVTILEHARLLGFWPIALNTNLTLLEEAFDILSLVDVLVVSLHSVPDSQYDSPAGVNWDVSHLVVENLRRIIERQVPRPPRLVVNCVHLPGRIKEARKVMDFCRRNGVWFSPVPQIKGKVIHPKLSADDEYRAMISKILSAQSSGEKIFGSAWELETTLFGRDFTCHPELAPHIYPNGDLAYPCQPLTLTTANILDNGSYEGALQSTSSGRPEQTCGHSCHLSCYVNTHAWIHRPTEAIMSLLGRSGGRRRHGGAE